MLLVSKSFHSLFSGSTSCLMTTSYPFKLEALCSKATVMFPLPASPLNSSSGGPLCDSSITVLTRTSLLPRGGERVLGLHNEHVISKGFVTALRQNMINAAASLRFHVCPSQGTSPLKKRWCYDTFSVPLLIDTVFD